MKKIVLVLAVLLVSVSACKNPFLKKMLIEEEKGKTVPEKPHAPFIEGGASLILSPDKLDITVEITTADSTPITVEGCTETELTSGTETVLHAQGTRVILKGKITALSCGGNKLTELNVQGLTALERLACWGNQLTALNVQGLTALQELNCAYSQLTALNVQGLTSLQELNCSRNQLTSLDVSGLTELQELYCNSNKIPELNVQGLTKLQQLKCGGNQLASLNVQGLTELQQLNCASNQLSSLNVQGCTALKSLLCFRNKLNADVFTKLFNDLPTREASDGAKARVYMKGTNVTEGNCTDFTTPESLKKAFDNAKDAKHWKMQKMNGAFIPSDI